VGSFAEKEEENRDRYCTVVGKKNLIDFGVLGNLLEHTLG
jgi:hypothetical protein